MSDQRIFFFFFLISDQITVPFVHQHRVPILRCEVCTFCFEATQCKMMINDVNSICGRWLNLLVCCSCLGTWEVEHWEFQLGDSCFIQEVKKTFETGCCGQNP